jgi:hypothetical protein
MSLPKPATTERLPFWFSRATFMDIATIVLCALESPQVRKKLHLYGLTEARLSYVGKRIADEVDKL